MLAATLILIAGISLIALARTRKERKSLTMKIEEQARELKSAEFEKVSRLYRFVEFGKLSGGIVHDIANPLTAITLAMENITNTEKNKKRAELAEKAFKASKRIEAIISMARKELDHEGSKGIFALENEVHEAAELLSHKSKSANVEIRIESGGNTMIWGNPVKFFQIAVNLISNAIDSYKESYRNNDKTKTVVAKIHKTDGNVIFEIKDSGCGMEKEIRDRIFEPFFTTKQNGDGIGLGLSTTKGIIEKDFGGSIELQSEPGKGSLFRVVMPARDAANAR